MLCVTATDVDSDSMTRWFTEVGVVSREQPQRHSRQLHRVTDLPTRKCSDGSVHQNLRYSQEVNYRSSDGQIHNSSQDHSGYVTRAGQNNNQQRYVYQGRGQRDEDIAVEPAYLPYYQAVSKSQQKIPAKCSTDYYCARQSISQSNQHQQLHPAMPQSHQQIIMEPNKDHQQSGTAQTHRPVCGPEYEDVSHYQPVLQSRDNMSVLCDQVTVYRAGPQPHELQRYLPVYQDMPQSDHISGLVYRAMPQTREDRQNQLMRTDSQHQLMAENLLYPANAGLAIQVPVLNINSRSYRLSL